MDMTQIELKKFNGDEILDKILTEERTSKLIAVATNLIKGEETTISFISQIISILGKSIEEFPMHGQTQLVIKIANDLILSIYRFAELVQIANLRDDHTDAEKIQIIKDLAAKERSREVH